MSTETFIFQGGKVRQAVFADKTIGELMRGPYIIKFDNPGFVPIYFAGCDDALWDFLDATGRFVVSLTRLVDDAFSYLERQGIKLTPSDIDTMLWHDFKTLLADVKRKRPDIISVERSEKAEASSPDTQGCDPSAERRKKFNSMLA
jgi:hypothetical protein